MGQGLTRRFIKQFDEFEHLTEPWVSPEKESAYRERYKIRGAINGVGPCLFL